MTKEELYRNIQQLDKEIQNRKLKRNLKLFCFITCVFFLGNIYWAKNSILDSILISLVCSGLYIFSGLLIWYPFIEANSTENKRLEKMQKEYEELSNSMQQ